MYSDLDDAFSAFGSVSTDTWIKSDKYTDYPIYHDEQYAYIEGRTIGDINSQISVQGESYSQYISFMMDRYYDGVDITTKSIWIHYELADGSGSESSPINVYYNDSNVRFGWIIPDQATQQAGDIKIGVWVTGTAPNTKNYLLKTETKIYTIKNGLVPGSGITQPDQNWFEQFVSQMDNKVSTSQGYANDAQASKTAAAGSATEAAQSATASAQALQENKDYVESQKETFVGYNKRETDLKYANALIGSASGTGRVSVGDAWEAPIPDLRISGESEQVSTTGAQLLQDSNIYPGFLTNANGTRTNDNNYRTVWLSLPAGTYTLSVPGGVMIVKTVIDGILNNSSTSIADGAGYTCTLTQEGFLGISFRKQDSSDYVTDPQVMLNEGATAKPWEPYTGGKPSPSPDYPQPIISTGTVTTGAQLLDIPDSIKTENGITAKCENGVITISGTPINQSGHIGFTVGTTSISPGIYTLSLDNKIVGIGMSVPSKPTGIIHLTMDTINKDISGVVEEEYLGVVYLNVDNTKGPINYTGKPMLNTGSTPKPWEPYTGGKPSPSEEYPQPLDVTVTGANLFDASLLKSATALGIKFTNNGDGSFTVDGTATGYANTSCPISLPSGTYSVSGGKNQPKFFVRISKDGLTYTDHLDSFTINGDEAWVRVFIQVNPNMTVNEIIWPMLNAGSTALTWQPYQSKTATIQLTSPLYAVEDHRDEITMTKRINRCVELVFDGIENWAAISTYEGFYYAGILPFSAMRRAGFCNQFPVDTKGEAIESVRIGNGNSVLFCVYSRFYDDAAADKGLSAWKAHLASHPLRIVTYLDTPIETDLPAATQSALNALTTFTGTTHITITAGGPEPDVAVEYVQDTNVIIAGLKKLIEGLINA